MTVSRDEGRCLMRCEYEGVVRKLVLGDDPALYQVYDKNAVLVELDRQSNMKPRDIVILTDEQVPVGRRVSVTVDIL